MGDDAHQNAGALAESREAEPDVDVEMALLTLSAQDMGEPTEDLDLSALTPTEKQVLLDMLRKRLGNVPPADAPHPADVTTPSRQGNGT